MTIEQRNDLRINAGLPLLDLQAEGARLAAVERDAAFERFFRENRYRYAALWSGSHLGWLSRAGLWLQTRRRLRLEFDAGTAN
jgi:hypothetical protein